MRRPSVLAAVAGAAALVLPVGAAQGANGHANYRAVCSAPPAGFAHCHVLVVTDERGNPQASTSPTGLAPATIQSVYGFPTASTAGAGATIGIVDAYDDPTAENDLNVFSSQFGLPACTNANGCFAKVNQTGGTSYPKSNSGWALEISLDIEWAHAIAPGAKILLVEASSNSFTDLLAAEDYAKTHAQYVSNSWGGSESSGESSYDSHFSQSGVSFFVSAGDSGLPAEYPSASQNVISVGGTTLHFSGSTFTGETGWSSGGGGCSAYETAASAQSSFSQYSQVNCAGKRATADVSLDADPNSGVSVYDSTSYYGQRGWFTVGGTSASSPMWAAASADAGAVVNAAYVYGTSINFRDITQGNNGAPCQVGFDLCSGRGSWLFTGSQPPPQGSLSFTSGAQTLTAGQPSAAMLVSLSATQASNVSVTLSSSSKGGGFSTSATGSYSATLAVTIAAGQTASGSFYYEDTKAGSPTLTASASGFTSASQTETVSAAALATIAVSPGSATVTAGGAQPFTAGGADQYGNPVGVSSAAWSTTAPGSLSPTTGSATTFTAGSTAGSGSVIATIGSIKGTATVTVVSASSAVRVNAGGAAYMDSSGNTWSADCCNSGGNVWSTTAAIAGTSDPVLYQSERWNSGPFTYTFVGLAAGNYSVTLKFAEIAGFGPGQRQFNVAIQGTQVLTNFDVAAQVGLNTALDKTFTATVDSSGQLTVSFTQGAANNPIVSAIQVVPASAASLSFSSGAQTLTAGQPSAAMLVSLSATQASNVSVTLSSSSKGGGFSTSATGSYSATLAVTIAAGQTASGSFYYEDTKAGSPTLTASASGFTSASQTETVSAAALATIAVSPGSATVTAGGAQPFTAGGADQYGNPVGVSSAAWSTTAPGSLSPTTGSATTFTAGSTAGSGSVIATIGSIKGTATVTVVSASSAVRVNAGGAAYMDSSGNTWSADCCNSGGNVWSTTAAIAGTSDPVLYQSERWNSGPFTYTFVGLAAGNYSVTLKFAEIAGFGPGQRQFNVAIQGTQVLTNFDVAAQVGLNTALDKTFTATVDSSGQFTVSFIQGAANNPIVSAIQVVPA